MTLSLIALCLASLAAPAAASPATSASPAPPRAAKATPAGKKAPAGPMRPINITSERFEIMPNAERAIWSGAVVAKRDDLRIACDKLTAEFGERRRIKSIVCEGHVHMQQHASARGGAKQAVDREAWGERAHFDNERSLVTVTGHPEAREGENRIQGEKVLFFIEEDRVVVEKPRMVLETEEAAGGRL